MTTLSCTFSGVNNKDHCSQSGMVLIFVVTMLGFLLSMVAIALDLGFAWVEQRRMQIATDAAALAAVTRIDDSLSPSANLALATPEAIDISVANGLTTAELVRGGATDVGHWDGSSYVVGGVPVNAIRVRAARSLPVQFARLLGWTHLTPGVESVARQTYPGKTNCLIPFGIKESVVSGLSFGSILNIGSRSPGNWGKIDIDGNMSSLPLFVDAMINGLCSREVSVGEQFNPGTGFAGIKQGFDARIPINPVVKIPIVDNFPSGSSAKIAIRGFAVVRLLTHGRSGANWSGEIEFLEEVVGSAGGGPSGSPFALGRALVR